MRRGFSPEAEEIEADVCTCKQGKDVHPWVLLRQRTRIGPRSRGMCAHCLRETKQSGVKVVSPKTYRHLTIEAGGRFPYWSVNVHYVGVRSRLGNGYGRNRKKP